ncbi:uncharacterized protein [Amphiura filiformis]|uniref:uncharacterized protein n=1 Tax=Amphiura filiformis TaxID=82378 RepID=UPI003B211BCB
MDVVVSPDDMDIMMKQAHKARRGGLDEGSVGVSADESPITTASEASESSDDTDEDKDTLSDLPVLENKLLDLPDEPIQIIKPKSNPGERTPLERGRLIANQVKNNLKWAKVLGESKQEEQRSFVVEDQDGKEQRLTFDVNEFKANVQTVSALPPAAKIILTKNPWERSAEDLAYLIPFVTKLKCFQSYSVPIKRDLASVLHYENFEDGRVIVRQGHPGLSFYFILSGTVTAEVTEVDKRTGTQHTQYVGQSKAGSSFGELSLLHGTKRAATIITKGDTEFLRLDKSDFDMVLGRSYQSEWDTRFDSLRSLSSFDDWEEKELRATNDRAKIVVYLPNTVILGDLTEPPDRVYFIKSGKCKVVREITMLQSQLPHGRTQYSLPPINGKHDVTKTLKLEKHQKLMGKYLHVATIKSGDFFGVGEDLQKTFIISIGRVECILVSQVAFLRHERGRCLEPMRMTVENRIPSYQTAFENYLESKRWRAYKRGLVKELAARRHIPNSTKFSDVPLVSRK